MKKKIIILIIISITLISFIVIKNKKENTTSQIEETVNLDNSDEKINWDEYEETTLTLNNKSQIIENEGIYTLNGNVSNGSITVKVTGNIKLILDNVNITNENGPAIIIESAENAVIELKENTINTLKDGKNYTRKEYDGSIYSKDDLIFQGEGTLNITSLYKDGIVSNDDLKIISGTYIINSNDDAIRGKDSVYIKNGNFTINSNADGIKSTNDTDNEKGYINIENGNFNIESKEDAFQAETKLIIENGSFNIKTNNGSTSQNSAIFNSFNNGQNYDETSSKALKSTDNLIIKNGSFTIDSKDDAIHSNNYIKIENAKINISSGDDGIHADKQIIIDSGQITITNSYEGIEASDITINGGNINLIASDDGINISGGNDSSSMNRPGQNQMSSSAGTLTVNNGKIYVNASGDGLDANGNIIINGGEIYVDGPTNDGNGALDYDTTFDINKGTVIAVGSRGMAQSASNSSKQYSLMIYLSTTYQGTITILDSNNNEIISYNPQKTYSSVLISTDKLEKNNTYTLKINNEEITSLTIESIITSNGNQNMHGQMQGGNKKPGRR